MTESVKHKLSKSFLIITLLSLFFCLIIIKNNNFTNNPHDKNSELSVKEIVEITVGEPISFESVNIHFKHFLESNDFKKYTYSFQKAYSIGEEEFDNSADFHSSVYIDENGNVSALRAGVYKLEYSLSEYDRISGTLGSGEIMGQKAITFSNIFAVYEKDYSDYAPFPYSDESLFSDDISVKNYIITKDITLSKSQAKELIGKKVNFGSIINPHGYVITIDTALGLESFISKNEGILDGIKINYVSDAATPVCWEFYSLVKNNIGYIKDCKISGTVYINNNNSIAACLPNSGFVYDNTISLVVKTNGEILSSNEGDDTTNKSQYNVFWKLKNNTINIDLWYFTDDIKALRRVVSTGSFGDGNVVKNIAFEDLDYNQSYNVALNIPVRIDSNGETLYTTKNIKHVKNSPLEIENMYWSNILYGNSILEYIKPKVLNWIVDGEIYDSLNEIVVTKDLQVEPVVKYTQSYKDINPTTGEVYAIYNADKDLVSITDYENKTVSMTKVSRDTILSLFQNPRAITPEKIIFNRDCVTNYSSNFWEMSYPHIQRYMDNGGQFIIENGNQHYTMIQANSLCTADGKQLLYYFPSVNQEEIVLHHQIQSTGEKAFFSSQNIKKLDITSVNTINFNSLKDLTSLTEIKLGMSIDVDVNPNYKFFLNEIPNLEVVKIHEYNQDYKVVDNFVIQKESNTLLFTPRNLTGTVTLPEGILYLNDNSLNKCNAEKVILPNTLKSFNDGAFNYMNKLEEIVFGESEEIWGYRSTNFYMNADALKRLVFSDVTQKINFGSNIFSNCQLEMISLPKNLSYLWINNNTAAFEISEENTYYKTIDGILYTTPYNRKYLNLYPIYKEGDTIEVPEDVVAIANRAFRNSNLKTVTLPLSVNEIYPNAFENSKIEKLIIESTTYIDFSKESFYNCANLSEIIMPDNISIIIGSNSFAGCNSLKTFDYKNVVEIGDEAFSKSGIERFEIGENFRQMGDGVFKYSELKDFKASQTLTEIPKSTFQDSKITNIDLGGVESIGFGAFFNCKDLITIDFKSVKTIGDSAFYGSGLISVESDNVIKIENQGFTINKDLTYASFPNLEFLGDSAFMGSGATEIHFPKIEIVRDKAFYDCQKLVKLTLSPKIELKDEVFFQTKSLKNINSVIKHLTSSSLDYSFLETINLEIGNWIVKDTIINNCDNLKTINIKQTGTELLKFSYPTLSNIKQPVDVYLDVYYFSWSDTISSALNIYVPINLYEEYHANWLHTGNVYEYDFTLGAVKNKLSLVRELNLGGNVTGGGEYIAGETVSVTANTNWGYIFKGWYNGDELVSQSEEYFFLMPNTALTLKAVWAVEQDLSYFNFTLLGDGTYGVSNAQKATLPLELILPKEYNGKAVTKLYSPSGNEGAFSFTTITKLFIPNSYTSIENNSFYNCTALESVIFEENSRISTINRYAFYGCKSLRTINIPQSVESIQLASFINCIALESVIFEEGSMLKIIRESVFSHCYNLKSIDIPSGVESIGTGAFFNCTALESVTFNDEAKISSIHSNAFLNCSKLNNIELPKSLIWIGSSAFDNTKIYNSVQDNVVYVSDWVVGYKGDLKDIELKSTTVGISGSAFYNCESLINIFIPYSAKYIGNYAFSYCINLESVIFEQDSNLLFIGSYAFSYCSSIETINIPRSVTTIGDYAFQSCDNMQAINVESGNHNHMSEGGVLFSYDKTHLISYPSGKTGIYTVPYGVVNIYDGAFYGSDNLTGIVLPESLTIIGVFAFLDCNSLTEVLIPKSVERIGDRAFSSCKSLQNISVEKENLSYSDIDGVLFNKDKTKLIQTPAGRVGEYAIPEQTCTIGNSAFSDCDSLTSITISKSVTAIEVGAFSGCSNLTEIDIPSSVKFIGTQAFWHCSKLTTVILRSETPPELGTLVFNGTPSNLKIYVPENSLDLYKLEHGWQVYSIIIQAI